MTQVVEKAERRRWWFVPRPVFWVLDAVELYLPALAFLTLFVVFNMQIVARYLLGAPLSWSTEVCQLAFVWTALLGASYMRRKRGHIVFDMVYEALPERGKHLANIASNLLIGLACFGSVPATLDWLDFLRTEHTNMLHIPLDLAYSPLLVFLVMIGIYSALDVISATAALIKGAR